MQYIKTLEKFKGEYSTCTSTPQDTSKGELHKQVCQKLTDILDVAKQSELGETVLLPNTNYSQLPIRLCVSILNEGYPESYRPEGLVFSSFASPDFCSPVDIMALTDGEIFTSGNYHAKLIQPIAHRFIKSSFSELMSEFPTHRVALQELNKLRAKNGFEKLTEEQVRPYNEFYFYEEITIKPVALISTFKEMEKIAEAYGLLIFKDVKEYMQKDESKFLKQFF